MEIRYISRYIAPLRRHIRNIACNWAVSTGRTDYAIENNTFLSYFLWSIRFIHLASLSIRRHRRDCGSCSVWLTIIHVLSSQLNICSDNTFICELNSISVTFFLHLAATMLVEYTIFPFSSYILTEHKLKREPLKPYNMTCWTDSEHLLAINVIRCEREHEPVYSIVVYFSVVCFRICDGLPADFRTDTSSMVFLVMIFQHRFHSSFQHRFYSSSASFTDI